MTDIYLFGDQTVRVEESLHALLHTRDNPTLTSFLNEAFLAIQHEISQLPAGERGSLPTTETLGLLLDMIKKGHRHAAFESALICLCEIAEYIRCAQTTLDLVPLGIEAVSVAFRVGMHVSRQAAASDAGHTTSGKPWTLAVTGVQENEATQILQGFINDTVSQNAPYISAVGINGVTISGTPSLIEALQASSYLESKKTLMMPVYGPYHAKHLYNEVDIDNILRSRPGNMSMRHREAQIAVISSSSGALLKESTFGDLLRVLVSEILTTQIRIDDLVDGIVQYIPGSVARLIPIHSHTAPSLASTLRQRGIDLQVFTSPQIPSTKTPQHLPSHESSKIAIIGFSGRFPEADGLSEFWTLLEQGLDVHKPIPTDRFDRDAHYDATLRTRNTSRILHGCWIRRPGLFDPRFFHFSPREASQADPAQRLALLTAYEAIEMAGFVPDRTASSRKHRVGVYYGTTSDDWREVNSGQDIGTYFIPGGNRAFIPGRINYFFKFSGPSVSVDTACSSSLAAINVATTALLNYECDTALAGGTNIMTNPDNFAGLDRGHFLSSTGNCKTFDDGADGYCRADGVGTVILKRLSDAIADNDPIFGIILGARTSHSAESVSITRPLADAQEYLFRQLLSESGLHPHDISYIEMHGTGTQAGDAVEMKSVLDTFAWDTSRPQNKRLHLGSVKANVGHGESASGVTALIKVLLMMQKDRIPPHCGIKTKINHGFPTDLAQRNVYIAQKETEWARPPQGKRYTFVNNFSAAGGNTALLLEDAPSTDNVDNASQPDPRQHHVVAVSARSAQSLTKNAQSLADFIGSQTSSDFLARISYTTTARRIHHPFRIAVVGKDLQQLKRVLLDVTRAEDIRPCPAKPPGVGFLFTGQGTQQTAMARQLYENFASFREDIVHLDGVGCGHGFPSILPLVTGTVNIEELAPATIQLGTVVIQIAMARLWQNWGLRPHYVLGHSLGEFAALHLAGVLSIRDTIYLAGSRAELLARRCIAHSHGMLAVKASVADVKELLAQAPVEVACINGPKDTVLSGPNGDIDRAAQWLSEHGMSSTRLVLPFAFHSSQVNPVLEELEQIANRVTFHKPTLPVVSPLLGQVILHAGVIGPQYIRRHCRETVNLLGAVKAAQSAGFVESNGLAIEVGAHPVLTMMIKNIVSPNFGAFPMLRRKEDAFKTLTESLSMLHLAGVSVNWDEYHRDFKSCHQVVTLPGYNWDYQNYWIQYQNNFCLTKGSPEPSETPGTVLLPTSTRLSPSVQRIVKEQVDEEQALIVIESDLHDPELLPVALDHKVNGLVLCPSSLYADIAFTLGDYFVHKRADLNGYKPVICNMAVAKALIVNETGPQLLRASLDMDWSSRRGSLELYSVDSTGKRTSDHAQCLIELQHTDSWQDSWRRQLYLIQRSIEQLQRGVQTGTTHKVRRGIAYRLFSSVVQYGPSYHGMEEVTFDSSALEATARVRLQSSKGQYILNPFWCDSFGHLTGFVMNSNDLLDLTEHVYVNHGWSFMRCAEPFSQDIVYQTHVKMQPVGENGALYAGDVYILRDNHIVAHYGDVTFQKVLRRVFEMLLPAPKPKPTLSGRTSPAAAVQRGTPASQSRARAMSPSGLTIWQQTLKVIAVEIDVHPNQLTDDVQFADMGVDSLMSLNITGTLRESLHLDVPSSLFEDCPSVQSLREYLSMSSAPVSNSDTTSYSSSSSESHTSVATPATALEDEGAPHQSAVNGFRTTIAMISSILAEEIGVSSKELSKVDDLAELGLDSLLSLTTLGRVREEMNLDLPHDFFLQHTSIQSITNALRTVLGATDEAPTMPPKSSHPPATSILLQGSSSCSQTLFLFPDGSGSSTSYAMLPPISQDLRVYGMNCPYMKRPEDLKCALQNLTPSYVAEVRRRQPCGPYNLAGWSAGGIAAYDAAQYLAQQGEKVERLILLDSPNPIGLGKLPPHFYYFLEKAGVFGCHGGQKPPSWLIQHFLSFIDALDKYNPVPFNPTHAVPRTTLIWAKDGVCKSPTDPRPEPQPDDPKEMSWLLENREDLGPNGWDQLLGRNNIKIESVSNANHFTMVREPAAADLVAIIRRAMSL
ncbi:hypothetical protein EYZ11_003572 [Aspergillus tanneri]|uniref:Type I Polyketide synthases (Type I PKS) n=1 Tax=Aspergillus tanneri TaxID=1220188 RepID=A0A4V3UQ46_9EURO|nr:hypothetical protein EYZ11_003572 [Aspergillus tanneri]